MVGNVNEGKWISVIFKILFTVNGVSQQKKTVHYEFAFRLVHKLHVWQTYQNYKKGLYGKLYYLHFPIN